MWWIGKDDGCQTFVGELNFKIFRTEKGLFYVATDVNDFLIVINLTYLSLIITLVIDARYSILENDCTSILIECLLTFSLYYCQFRLEISSFNYDLFTVYWTKVLCAFSYYTFFVLIILFYFRWTMLYLICDLRNTFVFIFSFWYYWSNESPEKILLS